MHGSTTISRARTRFGRVIAVAAGLLVAVAGFAVAPAGATPVGPAVSGTGICFGYAHAGGCEDGFGGTGSAPAGSSQLLGVALTATDGVAEGEQIVIDATGTGATFPSGANKYQIDNVNTSTGCGVSSVTVDSGGERAFVTMPASCVAGFATKLVVFVTDFEVPGTPGTFSLTVATTHDYSAVGTNTLSAISVPSAPKLPAVSRGDQSITVSWDPPDSDGGSVLNGYNVYCSEFAPSTSDTPSATTDASTTSAMISGLTAHTTYTCLVTAVNDAGQSTPSDTVSAAPYEVPGAPQNISSARGLGSVTLSWDKPADVGGTPITAYTAYCSTSFPPTADAGDLCGTFGPAQRLGTVHGLTNGVPYYVGLTASNAAGESVLSAIANPTPGGPPSRPWALRAKPFRGALMLRWKVPTSTGGYAITGYDVRCADNPLGISGAPPATFPTNHARISGLTSGTEYFCVVDATNSVDSSKPSMVVTGTPK